MQTLNTDEKQRFRRFATFRFPVSSLPTPSIRGRITFLISFLLLRKLKNYYELFLQLVAKSISYWLLSWHAGHFARRLDSLWSLIFTGYFCFSVYRKTFDFSLPIISLRCWTKVGCYYSCVYFRSIEQMYSAERILGFWNLTKLPLRQRHLVFTFRSLDVGFR